MVNIVDGTIELYGWEARDGSGKSDRQYEDYQYVKGHAEQHGLLVIVFRYEFADSEMVDDFTVPDPDAEPEAGSYAAAFCHAARESSLSEAWQRYAVATVAPVTEADRVALMDQVVRLARLAATKLGAEEGKTGAKWVFDGNTDRDRYVRCLELDEAGDPAWHDEFGLATDGPLSGEWADGRTRASLLAEIGAADILAEQDDGGEAEQEISDAYENAFTDAWTEEVLRVAREQTA
jgi:hypothetical protein